MFNVVSEALVERERGIAANYRGGLRSYTRLKLRCDPLYSAVAELVVDADTPVLDIGCGIGLLGLHLRARGFSRRYLGIDCDATKIERARQSAGEQGAMLTYETRDAIVLPPFAGSVAILDVLHYLDRDRQRALLRAAARRVSKNGILVVRTALQEPAWRYRATVLEERLLYGSGWMRMPARHFPRRQEIESAFDELGMQFTIKPLWGHTPFASFLAVARPRATV
jgi:2-polyprenyl-3-methyl-5-hydroxy-6-metoxy-1,4-benzoquinol methylase